MAQGEWLITGDGETQVLCDNERWIINESRFEETERVGTQEVHGGALPQRTHPVEVPDGL